MRIPSNSLPKQNPPMPEQRYIGDGVYAGFDGYSLILETSNGVSITNRVCLEPEVLNKMDQYREYVREFFQEEIQNQG